MVTIIRHTNPRNTTQPTEEQAMPNDHSLPNTVPAEWLGRVIYHPQQPDGSGGFSRYCPMPTGKVS